MTSLNKLKKNVSRIRSLGEVFNVKNITAVFVALAIIIIYLIILKDLPNPTKLNSPQISQSSQILDRSGKLLYAIYSEKNRTFVPLSEMPKTLQEATIAIEDKDFYRHGAVDFRGIARSVFSIVFKRQLQGGSTLTQQLVKNTLLTPERTLQRKIKEVVLAFATEALYPKNKILEMYLNQIPYGGTAYGAEAAAITYFGKHVRDLDLSEAALLAGLPEQPTNFSPFGSQPQLAKARQMEVLRAMHDQKYITRDELDKALKKTIVYKNLSEEIKAPHFVFYVKDELIKKYGERFVQEGGLKVRTSLDLDIQEMASATVSSEIEKIRGLRVSNGAALVTNPATGEILAMVGSKDYFDPEIDGNVNVTIANRQPGSSIKPLNYAVGIAKGYTAATPFVDQRVCYPSPNLPPYCPVNYDGQFHGVVSMREALGSSFNIPAVKMLKLNGVADFIASVSAMGITTFKDPSNYGLSLTLGGGEVKMIDMATAFGVLANGGYRVDLHPILEITNSQGVVIEKYTPPPSPIFGKKALPEGIAFIISHILSDNNARTRAFGPNSELRIDDKPVSVKTGTTNDYKDNWTIGYTPSTLVAVWVGNNDNTPMSGLVSGVTGAAPIWHDIMENLLQDRPASAPVQPASVEGRQVCATYGGIPQGEGRCQTKFEYFLKNKPLPKVKIAKENTWIDKGTQDLAKPGQTENVELKEVEIVTDATGDRYCISCPKPTPTPAP